MINSANTLTQCEIVLPVKLAKKTQTAKNRKVSRDSLVKKLCKNKTSDFLKFSGGSSECLTHVLLKSLHILCSGSLQRLSTRKVYEIFQCYTRVNTPNQVCNSCRKF